ncbi:hypothetical protein [Sorangium cellulosum]|uniref:hypothetical protein n=1 Tax=Sorangium cellulosum TaxID=56 RepID=UPI0013317782|nr:hypothetical protein [Sorangium cellulosum]
MQIDAGCIDFPTGTTFISGETVSFAGFTTNEDIDTRPGIKACALTGIEGAFNQNSFTDGAMIEPPATINGTWKITVTNGKKARWACAL